MTPPKHVAIIMDGNGRWGIKNKNSRNLGHKAGLITVEKIIKSSVKNNIKFLTLYAFSTENWKRPKLEIKFLMNLLETFLIEKIEPMKQNEGSGIESLLNERNVDYVSFEDWKLLDEYEKEAGQSQERPRVKVTSVEKMIKIIRDKKN